MYYKKVESSDATNDEWRGRMEGTFPSRSLSSRHLPSVYKVSTRRCVYVISEAVATSPFSLILILIVTPHLYLVMLAALAATRATTGVALILVN